MSPRLTAPDFSLLVQRSALARARIRGGALSRFKFPEGWPPWGWETDDVPRDDSLEAIRAWFNVMTHPQGPLSGMDAFGRQGRHFELDCSAYLRDARRLVRHVRSSGCRALLEGDERKDCTAHEASSLLAKIEENLFSSSAAAGPESNVPVLNATSKAALAIIRARKGRGMVGKEIVKALAKKGITITEPTWRKHYAPKLRDYGIENDRARGGYYDARACL